MLRWNGWGDDTVALDLPPRAAAMIRELIGPGLPRQDVPRQVFLERMPAPRCAMPPLISTDPGDRLDQAHGQSLPDWVGLRGGLLTRFPDGVARPTSSEELEAVLELAQRNGWVVIPFGGGTSVVGHLEVPEGDRPVLSLSLGRLRRLRDLDAVSRLATFEAGVRGPDLEAQLLPHGFTLGHYPQSFEVSTLGGWVATRSSGQQSAHYGRIEKLFAGGDLITPRGVLHMAPVPASAAGPDLREMVLGSEGRLGVLSRVIVRVSDLPERDEVIGIFFPDWEAGVAAARDLAGAAVPYSMLRLSNAAETRTQLALAGHDRLIEALLRYLRLRDIQDARGCLALVGFTGSRRVVKAAVREALSIFRRHQAVVTGKAMGRAWKRNRFRAPYLRNTLWDVGYAVDTLETAVVWDKVTAAARTVTSAVQAGLASWDEKVHVFSHLSHVYASGSSIYTTFVFRLAPTPQETLARWHAIKSAASRAVVAAGGTISHQHGVGVDHLPYLAAEKGALGMQTLQHLFTGLDPDQRMNPGKLVRLQGGL